MFVILCSGGALAPLPPLPPSSYAPDDAKKILCSRQTGQTGLAGLPWGWHFNPHTHPLPTGIPIGIPIPTEPEVLYYMM